MGNMKTAISGMLAAVFILFASFVPTAAYAETKPPSDKQLVNLKAYVETQFSKEGIVGGSYAVVYKNQIVAAEGIGYRDTARKQKASPETIYAIASVTKPLTAAAILQLAEQGKLDIHHPVQIYLPWFTYADKEKSKEVTIAHLLSHSAGINRYAADGSIFNDEKSSRQSIENAVRALSTVKMNKNPGEAGQYCNSCFNTLGLVIENVSGLSYYEYMHRFVFEPLGMNQTLYGHELAKHHPQNIAKEYSWLFGFRTDRLLNYKAFGRSQDPEGGIYTNVLDLSRYVSAVMGSGPAEMLPSFLIENTQRGVVPSEEAGWLYTYGGFTVGRLSGEPVLYKGGDGIGSAVAILFAPEKKIGIVLLAGESNSEIKRELAENMMRLLLGEKPSSFDVPASLFRWTGYLMLAVTIISVLVILSLVQGIITRITAKNRTAASRRQCFFTGMLRSAAAAGTGWLRFFVRPTQTGFNGYPLDWAIGLMMLFISALLGAVYYFSLSMLGQTKI